MLRTLPKFNKKTCLDQATSCILQPKHEKLKERIDHYRPKGEEFDKAYTYDYKSRTDDTELSQQQVTSEKITVSRKDITHMEEAEKPRYPKDFHVGRIVIEEIPEEEEVGKHEAVRRDKVKTRREIEKFPRKKVDDLNKIGKLDITDYEKAPGKAEPAHEITTRSTEILEKERKVRLPFYYII